MRKGITLIGASGSVGRQVLNVIDNHRDKFVIDSLCVKESVDFVNSAAAKYMPAMAVVASEEAAGRLSLPDGVRAVAGAHGIIEAVRSKGSSLVVVASGGIESIPAVLEAIECGKDIAIANKEALVCAGGLIMDAARRKGVKILPVDSEHSAVMQCIADNNHRNINRIILTASGGPFCRYKGDLNNIAPHEALKHPTWKMGRKITVDSATMLNKGLELIEARVLFGTDKVGYVIHPKSIVHGLCEFCDGAVMAQMAVPTMEIPIAYALGYPDRIEVPSISPLDLVGMGALEFLAPDEERFPMPQIAVAAADKGGLATTVLVSADEAAVELYLGGYIKFGEIVRIVQTSVADMVYNEPVTVDNIMNVDREVRAHIANKVGGAKSV